nr:translation initiation factor IF-2-like [Pan troglodytes]
MSALGMLHLSSEAAVWISHCGRLALAGENLERSSALAVPPARPPGSVLRTLLRLRCISEVCAEENSAQPSQRPSAGAGAGAGRRPAARQVAPPGGPSSLARTHSRRHPDHAPPPGRPSCSRPLCAGSSCLATPEPARAPSIAEPGPGIPVAAAKPSILPGGGGCTGARTENPPLSPTRGDCRVPVPAAPISLRWRSGREARPGGPQAGRAGDPKANQAMHLQPAWAPKLQPPSVCRQQPPGNSRALPHSPHLGTRARCPCGCGEARRSALQQLHGGGNRPSAPSPVAVEDPWLEVSSSGRGGPGRGQGLAGSQARGTRDPEAAQAVLHDLGAQLQAPGNFQAGWRAQPRRTGARCHRD